MEYTGKKQQIAKELFLNGANCAQAVLGAFQAETGLDMNILMKLASGFGGGMARMREVCGAVSGMFMAADLMFGVDSLDSKEKKDELYQKLQKLAAEFKSQTGSIICKELLGLQTNENNGPTSTPRTPQFYQKRPCPEMVALAADILEKQLTMNNCLDNGKTEYL